VKHRHIMNGEIQLCLISNKIVCIQIKILNQLRSKLKVALIIKKIWNKTKEVLLQWVNVYLNKESNKVQL
jgi:hypothetical protein